MSEIGEIEVGDTVTVRPKEYKVVGKGSNGDVILEKNPYGVAYSPKDLALVKKAPQYPALGAVFRLNSVYDSGMRYIHVGKGYYIVSIRNNSESDVPSNYELKKRVVKFDEANLAAIVEIK